MSMIPCAECVHAVDRTKLGVTNQRALERWPWQCRRNAPRCDADSYTFWPIISATNAAIGCGEGKLKQDPWQPFATAPLSGVEIVVWREDAGVFTAVHQLRDAGDPDDDSDYMWFSRTGDDLSSDGLPTLWRPLPSPPTNK